MTERTYTVTAPAAQDTRYLTVEETAKYLQLPVMTVYMHARNGSIPAAKLGKHWRFSLGQLDQWVMQNSNIGEAADTRILVIDDEPGSWDVLSQWYREAGCAVHRASSEPEARRIIQERGVDLVVMNPLASGFGGLATLREIRQMAPEAGIAIAARTFDVDFMNELLEIGTFTLLKKPFQRADVTSLVR